MNKLLSRVLAPLARSVAVIAAEGQPRPGPWYLPITQAWLPADVGDKWNWWQHGYDPVYTNKTAIVEACISAYAETVAMCPGDHWRRNDKGGRDRVETSALSRLLRKPNDYESISDLLLNTTTALYGTGNAYLLALRNDRFEVAELHLMDSNISWPEVVPNGEIFYRLGGNEIIDRRIGSNLIVPQRDVLHIRLSTNRHTLIGETPLAAVAMDMMTSGAINQQQIAFYLNQARPSFVLSTDQVIDKDGIDFLRDRWNEQSRGLNAGGTPILTAGLKPHMLATTPIDAQLADVLKLSDQRIALAFRIPLQILGIAGAGGATYNSTELLMQAWIASGLGFALNHIEEAIGRFFNLQGVPWEYCELDTSALLRSSFKERIEALARGVQGGIFAPNEARAQEEYGEVKFGDEPRVQQQMVPLSAAGKIPAAPGAPGAPPSPGPPVPPPEEKPQDDTAEQESYDHVLQRLRAAQSRHYRQSIAGCTD